MLRSAILQAPQEIWDSPEYENRTWRLAYHALWGVRFYLGPSPEAFEPWEGAIEGAESLGGSWEPEGAAQVDGVHTAEERYSDRRCLFAFGGTFRIRSVSL